MWQEAKKAERDCASVAVCGILDDMTDNQKVLKRRPLTQQTVEPPKEFSMVDPLRILSGLSIGAAVACVGFWFDSRDVRLLFGAASGVSSAITMMVAAEALSYLRKMSK